MAITKRDEIITFIRENRVSTTEVADCLGKSGAIDDIVPVNSGCFAVGEVRWAYAYGESNWDLHKQIENIDKDKIIFMEGINCGHRALAGELIAKYLVLYRQARAIVCNGKMRDAHRLIKERYPIWCKGVSPIGCFNHKPDNNLSDEILKERRSKYDGSVMVCDDCGVVIVPQSLHNDAFLQKLHNIEEQEDIWFDCIDRRKWSTFDTVCLKKYSPAANDQNEPSQCQYVR